jgi:hypothetical protein
MTTLAHFNDYLDRFERRSGMWWIIPGTPYHDSLNMVYARAGDPLETPAIFMATFYRDLYFAERYRNW